MTSRNLLVELLVQELPPKALQKLGEAFAAVLGEQLLALGLASTASVVTPYASPRRLAAHVSAVAERAPDRAVQQKLMPVAVGLDAAGQPSPALLKKLQALGADICDPAAAVAALRRAQDGKGQALFYDRIVPGAMLAAGLQQALDEAIAKLPIPKVMSYQLETDCALPGWSSVNFVRPAQGLVALHGSTVVPVKALGLTAGNRTQGHRFEAAVSPVLLSDADSYAATLRSDGAVIASFAERRAEIAHQLAAAAASLGRAVRVIEDQALLDEVTGLVEHPRVLVCEFESRFLDIPQECLILTMKAHQKYFPLLDAAGRLTHQFLVVSNISPEDPHWVIDGNQRVVRPRLADAQFFFDQDRRKPLAARVDALCKVVYHHQLGTQAERVQRVRAIAALIAKAIAETTDGPWADAALAQQADQAALLAKADLVTGMVGEFPELQGTMGRYYALDDGLGEVIADAIEDHYKPRFAGDSLPRNRVGVVLALADKLETLVGMFGIGNLPTGERDPFALRRHALGLIRMLVEKDVPLELNALLAGAWPVFGDKIGQDMSALTDFIYERLAGSLREQGYGAREVDAVLAQRPQRLALVEKRLAAVRAFAALPESPALAAANKRVANILKKVDAVDPHVNPGLLREQAEQDLYAALQRFVPEADAQFDAGDYSLSLQTLAVLRAPVDAFFDDVLVNVEQMDLRLNRLGLLKSLHQAMNRVADLSRLAA
ncbi:glycine--tRNA ligase subunit beta [Verminephrobacter eiseniae]|uniref:glycine--tRNA ligase subunit beta n=1 Tax=Verminephrobacter eiseniae TaxID=364317 RepID=UPI002238835F|nr:glycine--tRNA ligase subunit beta [Verminephrobacter eiseniae]MCW5238855.1 glycine--tRNA ligase subunit beta [Verminephrobacter eiseniae]